MPYKEIPQTEDILGHLGIYISLLQFCLNNKLSGGGQSQGSPFIVLAHLLFSHPSPLFCMYTHSPELLTCKFKFIFSTRGSFIIQQTPTKFGDISGCHNLKWSYSLTCGVQRPGRPLIRQNQEPSSMKC